MNRTIANVRCRAHEVAEMRGFIDRPDTPDIDRTTQNVRHRKTSRRPDRHGHIPIGCVQCPVADAPPMGGFIPTASWRNGSEEYECCPYERGKYPRATFVGLQFLLCFRPALRRRDHVADREDGQHANHYLHGSLPRPAMPDIYSMSEPSQSERGRGSFPLPPSSGGAEPRSVSLDEKFEMEFRR